MSRGRVYTLEERAEWAGLAAAMGPARAADKLGIPRSTVRAWRDLPALRRVVEQTRTQVAEKLWQGVALGVDEVLRGLQDPKTRLGDKARALEVLAQQHALLTGGATSRTANVNVNLDGTGWADTLTDDQAESMRKSIDGITALADLDDAGLQAWLADGTLPDGTTDEKPGIVQLRDLQRQEAGNG